MILSRIFAATPENPSFDINSPEAWDLFSGGSRSATGESVNRDKALTHAPWWRGINLISSDVAKLPLLVYRDLEGGGRTPDHSHPAWRLLRRKPNEYMTAYQFKKTLIAHALQQGNGYAYVFRNGDGSPRELLLLDPDETYPVREDGRLYYLTDAAGETRSLAATDVIHIRGLSNDGLCGYSVYDKARESIALGLATRKYGSVFFRNNARPNVAIEVPTKYDEKAQNAFRQGWERIQGGLENSHRVALLWGGAKLTQYSINAQDAQLLETRQFETREVALWIGVPPHKLGDSTKASYNSLEQENQDYLDNGLDCWLKAVEEECWDKLLSESEKDSESHEILFDRKQLVRADLAARASYYSTATGGRPWMTPDEVRNEEDLEAMGGAAAELRDPASIGQGSTAADPSDPNEPDEATSQQG